jgi:hypothetical protein
MLGKKLKSLKDKINDKEKVEEKVEQVINKPKKRKKL